MLSPLRVPGYGYAVYLGVWQGPEPHLVVLKYPGGELFGTPYDVAVLDQHMALVRCGSITTQQDDVPYGLVEIRATGEKVAPSLRDRWLLGVATWNPDTPFEEDAPTVLSTQGTENQARANRPYVVPVEWWGDAEVEKDYSDFRSLFLHQPTEVRWAESLVPVAVGGCTAPTVLRRPLAVPSYGMLRHDGARAVPARAGELRQDSGGPDGLE